MSAEEKIGQLFIMLDRTKNREEEKRLIQKFHIGGCRFENEPADKIYEQNKFYQECADIPLLIAFNGESGGNGACSDGTYVASGAACEAARIRRLQKMWVMSEEERAERLAATGISDQ